MSISLLPAASRVIDLPLEVIALEHLGQIQLEIVHKAKVLAPHANVTLTSTIVSR